MCGAKNVVFDGVFVEHTAWEMPPAGMANRQAAYNVKASAIDIQASEGIVFRNGGVAHTGAHGIWISRASKDCVIEHARIEDIGAGAVLLGDEAWRPTGYQQVALAEKRPYCERLHVRDSIIRHGGRVLEAGVGVLLAQARACSVVHNDIYDFYGVWRSVSEPHVTLELKNNIFHWTNPKADALTGRGPVAELTNIVADANIWWPAGTAGKLNAGAFKGVDWDAWRRQGHDARGLVADPLFVDPARRDWRLAPESPARKLGFREFDWTKAGVSARDPAWRTEADVRTWSLETQVRGGVAGICSGRLPGGFDVFSYIGFISYGKEGAEVALDDIAFHEER